MSDIGKMIFDRRKELGFTLEEVGEACGVGKSTVRKWENGMIKNMKRDKIVLLAKKLRLPAVSFVPSDDLEDLSSEEQHLISLWRSAEDAAKEIALETLINHQKKSAASEPSAI